MENLLFWAVAVARYVYKSILRPCMDSYCYFLASAPSRFLDKLKKRVCRTVGPYLMLFLNGWLIIELSVVSLIPFYRYFFGRY